VLFACGSFHILIFLFFSLVVRLLYVVNKCVGCIDVFLLCFLTVISDQELSTDAEADSDGPTLMDNIRYSKDSDGNRIYNGVVITKSG